MGVGIEVYDSAGALTFDGSYFSMRVIGIVNVRDATVRSSAWNITTSLATAGVVAIVLPMQAAYWDGWSVFSGDTSLARLPIVTVHEGYITLKPFGGSTNYQANIDVLMVRTT